MEKIHGFHSLISKLVNSSGCVRVLITFIGLWGRVLGPTVVVDSQESIVYRLARQHGGPV